MQIETIGVVTCERAELLARCVASVVEASSSAGRRVEIVVADDGPLTRGGGPSPRQRAALDAARAHPSRWLGRAERHGFAPVLAEAAPSVPRDLVDYALFGDDALRSTTAGANRNAFLLDFAGTQALGVDDDALFEPRSGRRPPGTPLSSLAYAPWDLRFFPDARRPVEETDPSPGSLLAAHEAVLGEPLRALALPAPSVPPHPAAQAAAARLTAPSSRVAATLNGAAGDSGWGGFNALTMMVAHPDALLAVAPGDALGRGLLRSVGALTITAGSWFQAIIAGYDGTALLPPHLPQGRNQDGVFGQCLRLVDPHAFIAYLPEIVPHLPGPRSFPKAELHRGAARARFSDVLLTTISLVAPRLPAGSSAERLRALGSALVALASTAPRDLEELLRTAILGARSRVARAAARIVDQRRVPEPWAGVVREARQAVHDAAQRRDVVVPVELDAGHVDHALRRTAALVAKFGRLLEAWPDLFEAAQRLRAEGRRASRACG